MSISTSLFYRQSINTISDGQKKLATLQAQLGSGVRVQKPSDDPLAMATAMGATQAVKQLDQFQSNITLQRNKLNGLDTALTASSDTFQSIKETLTAAGNGILNDSDRQNLAQQLSNQLSQLRSIANRQDSDGSYLFSGISDTQPPFNAADQFVGSNTTRAVQVAGNQTIDSGVSGDVFTDGGSPATSVFTSLQNVINELQTPGAPNLNTVLQTNGSKIDAIYDRLLIGQTRLGGRLKELDTVEQLNASASDEYQRVAGESVGLDYAKTISDLSQTQLALQASQQAFAKTSQMSLFDYLK